MPATRSTLVLLSLSLALAACNGRSIDPAGDDEVGDEGEGSDWASLCAGPDAPTQPVELVSGAMTPGPFARVHDRVYWADQWNPFDDEPVHVQWAHLDAPMDWHTVTDSPRAVRALAGNTESAFWLEGDFNTPNGELWRVDADGELTLLDEALTEPQALEHRAGLQGGWLYYTSRSDSTPEAVYQVRRAQANGDGVDLLAEAPELIVAMDLSPTQLWWADFAGGVWRMPLDGGEPELAFDTETFPDDLEVVDPHVFVRAITGLYRLSPGAEPYYLGGLGAIGTMAGTDTHIYVNRHNVFEDAHLGWIHRYPVLDGEYDIFDDEFVTDKFAPAPQRMADDADALYWSTADEDTGQGGVWMLCKDHD